MAHKVLLILLLKVNSNFSIIKYKIMMTISNPESSLHFEKNFFRDRFKVKSVLFLLTFLSFGFNLIGQNSGDAQDLEQFKSTWMTDKSSRAHLSGKLTKTTDV